MSHSKAQGLPDEVLCLASAKFFDEEECTSWWLKRCYPSGPRCPDCGTPITNERALQSFRGLARFTCPGCGHQPRATKGSILEGARLTPRELFLLCLMLALNAPCDRIAAALQLSIETVRSWRDRLKALAEVES